jgi:RNA polymerase sigma-70 factor (ECF subfamily)
MSDKTQDENQLHERLLRRDPTASEEAARIYLPLIERHVRIRAKNIYGISDREFIWDVSVDTVVMDYILHPSRFDPSKSGLLGYLKRAAERDLINAVKKRARRTHREELHPDVEEGILGRNKPSELAAITRDAEKEVILNIQRENDLAAASENVGNEQDGPLLRLMADGERSTAKFAALLGIESLPIADQRQIVKQHKDRLKVRLKRRGKKGRD